MERLQSVYMIVNKGSPLPTQAPTIYQMIRMIGKLGGFLGRKGDGELGIKSIWTGLQKMKDYSPAWEIFITHRKPVGNGVLICKRSIKYILTYFSNSKYGVSNIIEDSALLSAA